MPKLWRGRGYAGCVVAWAVSRALLVAAPYSGYPRGGEVLGDVRLYARWAGGLADGRLPTGDPRWQYPPGAGAVLVIPRLDAAHYTRALVILLLVADAAVLALLLARARRGGSAAGAWTWVIGVAALGPVAVYRFDLVPTLCAVAGLALGGRGLAAGALLGVGGLIKVWPILLAPAVGRRAVAAAAVVVAAGGAALLVTGRLADGLGFLVNQSARGLQLESIAATPYLLARAVGADGIAIRYEYGAYQISGPGVGAVVSATTVATVAVLAAFVVLARRGAAPVPLALATLLAVVVAARVLSPQYLVWVLGVAGLALASGTRGLTRTAVLLVAAAALSQLLYPLLYGGLRRAEVLPAVILLARNALLVAATVTVIRALRTTGYPPETGSGRRRG